MKKAVAGLVLVLAACSVGRPAPDASGEEIYALLCSNCHGEDMSGALGPSLGPGSNSADQPDEFLSVTILHGRGRMPSFSSSLDEAQVERLIGYIREAQRR